MKKLISLVLALSLCASLAAPALATGADTGQIISVEFGEEIEANLKANLETGNALMASLITASSAPGFGDVPATHNFHDAIMSCAEAGIIGGYKDGTFQPSKTVTRSNFLVMLSRGFFADDVVKYSTPYLKSLNASMPNYMAMFKNGILEGTSFEKESCLYNASIMTAEINRYDMAQLITNIMDKHGFAVGSSEKQTAISKISDYSRIPSQYKDAVANVYVLGVIGGYKDGSFNGDITMNRGQAAAVINRMMQYVPEQPETPVEKPETPEQPKPEVPETPAPVDPTPVQPVDPTPSQPVEATLTNGKAITEENVTEMLNELLKEYPEGMAWNGSTKRPGTPSTAIQSAYQGYTYHGSTLSALAGCSGFASMISDRIFGSWDNLPARKVPVNTARPGDILIRVKANGEVAHVMIAFTRITGLDKYATNTAPVLTSYDGNNGDAVGLNPYEVANDEPTAYYTDHVECWTRYPSNGTPVIINPDTSTDNDVTDTSSTGSSNTTSDVSYTDVCSVCGKATTDGVYKDNFTRFVCTDCNRK